MKIPAILSACAFFALAPAAYGLATEEIGPKVDRGGQSDWPKGIEGLARHPTRVYSFWMNGAETFYFQASPAEVNELAALFCKARMRDHQIRIESGPRTIRSFGGNDYDYNVCLHIVAGMALSMGRTRDAGGTLEPCLTIYAETNHPALQQLKVPDNAIVHCELPDAPIKGKATRPARAAWHGRVHLEGASAESDIRQGLVLRITLWDDTSPDGIELANANAQGHFQIVFSEAEITALKQGTNWLTVTVGNYATAAKKEDPRFPVALLAREADKAQPFTVARPKFYWGRLLFEDGSAAILEPAPWPGAEIYLDFSYTGTAKVEPDGYFRIFFTPEQFEALRSQKPRRNVYIPMEERGRSSAMETYPPELLSQDKAKAGVVKIAKPLFKPRYDPAKAPSLLGKPLPSLDGLKLPASSALPTNRPILLCFFDLQERPSRHCLNELAKSAADLKAKSFFVAGIQCSPVGAEVLSSFARTNHVPFPLGMIPAEEAKTKFNWGLRSQPWLILTDPAHIVRAEGFPAAELSQKMQALR